VSLGLRAFGAAGFVGREPGNLVVEPHAEDEARRRLGEAIAQVPELRREAHSDPLLALLLPE
jgi:hypothetical protein